MTQYGLEEMRATARAAVKTLEIDNSTDSIHSLSRTAVRCQEAGDIVGGMAYSILAVNIAASTDLSYKEILDLLVTDRDKSDDTVRLCGMWVRADKYGSVSKENFAKMSFDPDSKFLEKALLDTTMRGQTAIDMIIKAARNSLLDMTFFTRVMAVLINDVIDALDNIGVDKLPKDNVAVVAVKKLIDAMYSFMDKNVPDDYSNAREILSTIHDVKDDPDIKITRVMTLALTTLMTSINSGAMPIEAIEQWDKTLQEHLSGIDQIAKGFGEFARASGFDLSTDKSEFHKQEPSHDDASQKETGDGKIVTSGNSVSFSIN